MIIRATWALGLALSMAACGNDTGSTTGGVANGPTPAEMCGATESPAFAAYDLATGEYKWSSCSSEQVRRHVVGASEAAVYVEVFPADAGQPTSIALNAEDGTELPDGAAEDRTDPGASPVGGNVVVDGIRIEGGQDDPTTGIDAATGEVLWTQAGSPAYDDLWAVGDRAVYVVDQRTDPSGPRLVAYELRTGEPRWVIGQDMADELWPWYVDNGVLFAMWNNLALISTDDGSTIWRTHYPAVEFPRMTGVRANSDTVFVAFSSVPSGGD